MLKVVLYHAATLMSSIGGLEIGLNQGYKTVAERNQERKLIDFLASFRLWFDIPISPEFASQESSKLLYALRLLFGYAKVLVPNRRYSILAAGNLYNPGQGADAKSSRE